MGSIYGYLMVCFMMIGSCGSHSIVLSQDDTVRPLPPPKLYIAGDSTAHNGAENGWGSHFQKYVDPAKLTVVNRARGGRSSRTFITEGLWNAIQENLRPGDTVIIQFGHNDAGRINDNRRARGTLKGNGDDAEEIDNMLTGKHEVVHSYGWYIRQYIKDTKAKGATPIVCSLIPRNHWTNGKINRSVNSYGQWAALAAKEENVPFIDLNQLICDHYDEAGQERVTALYFDGSEKTHTNAMGAQQNATCLARGIKGLKGCSLADYLKVVKPQ